ncbi:MAG TPA: bifunctional nuclease family protein [Gemmatimonadaceae bacterium]|nr:bifunctional nuclease family protein [Gemmatimonadaceae bacterium]
MELVEVDVMRLGLDRSSNSYVVILQEKDGSRLLPIWIGQPEAESIVIEMNRIKRERPLTHDLCKNLIVGMGGSLRRVHITKVQNRTFFAELHIAMPNGMVQIDARPSDSIAVALRFSAPIFAQASLLTALLIDEGESDEEPEFPTGQSGDEPDASAETLKQYLENLRPEDFGKFNM